MPRSRRCARRLVPTIAPLQETVQRDGGWMFEDVSSVGIHPRFLYDVGSQLVSDQCTLPEMSSGDTGSQNWWSVGSAQSTSDVSVVIDGQEPILGDWLYPTDEART